MGRLPGSEAAKSSAAPANADVLEQWSGEGLKKHPRKNIQYPSSKIQRRSKIQVPNSKSRMDPGYSLDLESWILFGIWRLEFGGWILDIFGCPSPHLSAKSIPDFN